MRLIICKPGGGEAARGAHICSTRITSASLHYKSHFSCCCFGHSRGFWVSFFFFSLSLLSVAQQSCRPVRSTSKSTAYRFPIPCVPPVVMLSQPCEHSKTHKGCFFTPLWPRPGRPCGTELQFRGEPVGCYSSCSSFDLRIQACFVKW